MRRLVLQVLRWLVRRAEQAWEPEKPAGWVAKVYFEQRDRKQWYASTYERHSAGPYYLRLCVYHAPYNGHGQGDWRWAVGANVDQPPRHRAGYAHTPEAGMEQAEQALLEIEAADPYLQRKRGKVCHEAA